MNEDVKTLLEELEAVKQNIRDKHDVVLEARKTITKAQEAEAQAAQTRDQEIARARELVTKAHSLIDTVYVPVIAEPAA